MRVAKNMKQANIKRIRSRFASIRFEANKFFKLIRCTLAWTWHGHGHGHGRVDVDMNMDMDNIRSVFMSLPMSVSEKWESWQRSVKKYSGKWQFCGELPSPPGDSQTSPAYSIHFVQYLYINQLLPANKPVLSYLLLCLLPQC
jgi:hypothetical protein